MVFRWELICGGKYNVTYGKKEKIWHELLRKAGCHARLLIKDKKICTYIKCIFKDQIH